MARRIGLRLGMEITNLDDLFWVNNGKNYGVKRPVPEREALLDSVLARESWIIEGAYVEWPRRGIEEADVILYLDRGLRELKKRIIMRFIRRKLGKDRENKIDNFRSLTDLLAWNRKQIVKISACIGKLQAEGKNLRIARDEKDVESFIAEIVG